MGNKKHFTILAINIYQSWELFVFIENKEFQQFEAIYPFCKLIKYSFTVEYLL